MNTMRISVALVVLCVMVSAGTEDSCPAEDSTCDDMEDDNGATTDGYAEIRDEAERALSSSRESANAVSSGLRSQDDCMVSDDGHSRSKRQTVAQVFLGRSCEPCPPNVHLLHRFNHGACYVIYPYKQRVRYVTCPLKCNEPCWCGNTKCVRTRRSLVFVWAWCKYDAAGGYKKGLNYRWLWLYQDCECREVSLFGDPKA